MAIVESAGVIQDSSTFTGTLTGTNDTTISGKATTAFKAGMGSFPATVEFIGILNTKGDSITGHLWITSEVITQSVSVKLTKQ